MLIALALATADPAAFLAAVRALDLPHVEQMLSADPSLAAARDAKGSAVSSALGARRGKEGFLPRRDNRVLDAILKLHPPLTSLEVCSVGTASEVSAQIAKDPAFARSYASNGWTPLHAAAFANNAAAAAILIAAGAEVDARAKNPGKGDGELLFQLQCARCHTKNWSFYDPANPGPGPLPGPQGGGAYGPNLTGGDTVRQFAGPKGVQDQIDWVTSGKPANELYGTRGISSGRMPHFGSVLTKEQIQAIVDYERGL